MQEQDPDWDPEWDLPPPDPRHFSLEAELQTNGKLRREDLDLLADWVEQEGLPCAADSELVKFLHGCDYNLEDAKRCAKIFFNFRKNNADIFSYWDVQLPNFKSILEIITFAILPRRTPDNYRIIYSGLLTSETKNYAFLDVCKLLLMAIETIFRTEPTIDGVVFIYDLPLAHMGHFWAFGFSLPRKLANYTQGGMPLKLAETHVIRCPSLIDNGMKMIKHFVPKKDWEKVFVYRSEELTLLYKNIPKNCLPSDFGGTLPSVRKLTDMTVKRFESFKTFFDFRSL